MQMETIKNSAEILEDIGPPLSHNINSPILLKHGQSNSELQTLKNYILKIEAQMSALKSHVKCELSTLTNKTEIEAQMSALKSVSFLR